MKKGLLLALVVMLVLAAAVPAAMALTDKQKDELAKLYEQEHQLRLQIVEKQAESGVLTKEDAKVMQERMTEQWQDHEKSMQEGNYSFGPQGRGGGRGGRRNGNCGNCPYNQQGSAVTPEQSAL
ncbi:MAG TPA: DUF2680 domain-containing protein [Oscillospiraceae bacterium]|nr:DUF2680 domain-containing protein [Oscillospiraceae bacterium]